MKRIVIMAGHGLNERGWAGHISKYGKVVLIQEGFTDHVECWEGGQRTFFGPEVNVSGTRYFDNLTFGGLTMWRALRACQKYNKGEKIDLIIGVGYSMALAALFLRIFGKTRKFACSVVDHLPLKGSLALRIHRLIAGWLTHLTAKFADEVWVISPRIPAAQFNPRNYVISFPLDDHGVAAGNRTEIAYIGVPSHDHGLDLLFEACRKHAFTLNIIGDSQYLQSIKEFAPPQTVFHGWLNDKERVNAIFARCFCGYAVYRATGRQSYSYYGFPSKALSCFASNTPILTTKTSSFTQQVESLGIGRVIEPTLEEVESALLDLKEHYPIYYEAINRFRASWNAEVERFHRERLAALLGAPSSVP
jgi:glycosyltransferase involved in cell wall biosynthesis